MRHVSLTESGLAALRLQIQYLESVPTAALEVAQTYIQRARCLFDYTQNDAACSPYSGIAAQLQAGAPASVAALQREWTLPRAADRNL